MSLLPTIPNKNRLSLCTSAHPGPRVATKIQISPISTSNDLIDLPFLENQKTTTSSPANHFSTSVINASSFVDELQPDGKLKKVFENFVECDHVNMDLIQLLNSVRGTIEGLKYTNQRLTDLQLQQTVHTNTMDLLCSKQIAMIIRLQEGK
ncbi:Hypothetical_protein [Hexamita inflata]|uniref:Hypothetical_protein n=1 Tax=Hexamita inflata TaxID=28002 RepID=A0AA86UFM4_9EUKA|nr:Hypothetical protein HINF_LOCUS37022 [Hexamita inflata]